ncbi:MAG TPA: hypothetical protein VL181_10810 [Holophagaceae bacterium]|nr:hypothetical protein [Holophagaceae bacterium]
MIPFPGSLRPAPGEPGAFLLEVAPEHPAFEGHFPDLPILPGVVQVDWALRLGGEVFGPLGDFESLEHLKFQAVIRPGEPLRLSLAWDAEQRELAFAYTGGAEKKSSGFARFAPRP